jgi:glycerol-1-phosphate dehydrogenase [NAD(P)+]
MNGYASANASIEGSDGLSRSFKAHMPKAIFFDSHILVQSPKRLTASGFADIICRSTVQADWLLSHLLLDTEYNPLPFEWLENFEQDLIKNTRWLEKGDKTATIELANAVILSGIGMYICGGSYPASQGEHLIAHTSEMAHKNILKAPLHGEKIAVTLLTMAKLQEFMLKEKPQLETKEINEQDALDYFGAALGHHILNETEMKFLDKQKIAEINANLDKNWNAIRGKIRAKMIPHKTLKEALELIGAPTKPEDIGWNKNSYKTMVKYAFLTRNRFTFLDLAFYSGKMDEFLDHL